MTPTPAGQRRHRITVQRYTTTSDLGQEVQTWSTVGTYWAKVSPVSSSEDPADDGTTATVKYRINMLYTGTITHKDRIVYGGRNLMIESIINVEELNIEYLIQASEVE